MIISTDRGKEQKKISRYMGFLMTWIPDSKGRSEKHPEPSYELGSYRQKEISRYAGQFAFRKTSHARHSQNPYGHLAKKS
jgi:hypothetical protein